MTDQITKQTALREVIGEPMTLAATKEMPALDAHCRKFITMSPFLVLATVNAEGDIDVSPRGDPPGFVHVVDDRTLLIPDRPGNRRVDSMTSILAGSKIGMIFFLPGVEETLRIQGRPAILSNASLLKEMAVNGKTPKLAIRVEITEVFFHCAKALKRSKLWHPDTPIERGDFPRYGEILKDQRDIPGSADEIDEMVQGLYRKEMY